MAGSYAKCLSYLALFLLVPAGLVLGGNPDAKRLVSLQLGCISLIFVQYYEQKGISLDEIKR